MDEVDEADEWTSERVNEWTMVKKARQESDWSVNNVER